MEFLSQCCRFRKYSCRFLQGCSVITGVLDVLAATSASLLRFMSLICVFCFFGLAEKLHFCTPCKAHLNLRCHHIALWWAFIFMFTVHYSSCYSCFHYYMFVYYHIRLLRYYCIITIVNIAILINTVVLTLLYRILWS